MVSTGSDEDNVSNVRYHNDINRTMTDLGEFVIQMSKFAISVECLRQSSNDKFNDYWSDFYWENPKEKRKGLTSKATGNEMQ